MNWKKNDVCFVEHGGKLRVGRIDRYMPSCASAKDHGPYMLWLPMAPGDDPREAAFVQKHGHELKPYISPEAAVELLAACRLAESAIGKATISASLLDDTQAEMLNVELHLTYAIAMAESDAPAESADQPTEDPPTLSERVYGAFVKSEGGAR